MDKTVFVYTGLRLKLTLTLGVKLRVRICCWSRIRVPVHMAATRGCIVHLLLVLVVLLFHVAARGCMRRNRRCIVHLLLVPVRVRVWVLALITVQREAFRRYHNLVVNVGCYVCSID